MDIGLLNGLDSLPTISVVMVTHNNCFYTRLCLDGLRNSRAAEPPFELIIVDNGSTDDSEAVFRNFAEDIHLVIRNKENRGFAAASNQGAKRARGEHLVFLNNDIVVKPGWLKALLGCALSDPRIGAVGARLLFPDGTLQHAGVVFDSELRPHSAFSGYPGDWPEAMMERDCQVVTAACMLVTKSQFFMTGGFDEVFRNSFEDVDLCFKIGQAGYRIVYCPLAAVYHFESSTAGRFLRDDRNYSILLDRWSSRIVPDFDPARQRYPEVEGEASLVRIEHAKLARRVASLGAENENLREVVERQSRLVRAALIPGDSDHAKARRYDLIYSPGRISRALTNAAIDVPITIENAGTEAWAPNQLSISYHWRPLKEERHLVWDGHRTSIADPLGTGRSITLLATVIPPEQPGSYWLEWDAVDDSFAWLSTVGVVPFRQLVLVQYDTRCTARIEGLPAFIKGGESADITVQISNCPEGVNLQTALFQCRWGNAAINRTRSNMQLCAPESSGRMNPLRFRVEAPLEPGHYQVEIYQNCSQNENHWVPLETVGGAVYVLGVAAEDAVMNQQPNGIYAEAMNKDAQIPEYWNQTNETGLLLHKTQYLERLRELFSLTEAQLKCPKCGSQSSSADLMEGFPLSDWMTEIEIVLERILVADEEELEQERKNLRELNRIVEGYRNGRMMRIMNFLRTCLSPAKSKV